MSITINGSGTITGISAGGLPDGSITNDDLAGSIADAKLSGTTCKAFVNFNGTGSVAIRAQFNVSSITDNGTGDYTVNFATALADANYSAVCMGANNDTNRNHLNKSTSQTTSAIRLCANNFNNAITDLVDCHVAIFR
jgi:hypothetical protein